MSVVTSPTPEEIQRIAAICGELSLGGCGIVQYRATFPMWTEAGHTEPQIYAVQPEQVDGIYHAIWLRLRAQPEYQPLAEAERDRDMALASLGAAVERERAARKRAMCAEHYAAMQIKYGPEQPDEPLQPDRWAAPANPVRWAREAWEAAKRDDEESAKP